MQAPTRMNRIWPKENVTIEDEKPAILWNSFDCTSNEYWEMPLNTVLWESGKDGQVEIKFKQLLAIIEHLLKALGAIDISDAHQVSSSQPIFAISIPEGPYLQFAVLVIHLLNITCIDATKAPVILPLDPDEGIERLIHMMSDAKPAIIIHARQKDEEKIYQAIDSLHANMIDSKVKYSPVMINLKTLLSEESIDTNRREISNIQSKSKQNRISHIVYTSGTTGRPKGCISSLDSLLHYIRVKNVTHQISINSKVFLASALPFDPCLSDIIATFYANAALCLCPRDVMKASLGRTLCQLHVTHVLCTPTLWSSVGSEFRGRLGSLEVVALGGEVMPRRIRGWWARRKNTEDFEEELREPQPIKLLSTYGVTEACVYQTAGEVFMDVEVVAKGQEVGVAFDGLDIEIWPESKGVEAMVQGIGLEPCIDGKIGEIVLSGRQIDEYSGYLNMPGLSKEKFIAKPSKHSTNCIAYYYRTGDRGKIDPQTGHLIILGRIDGEQGMIKINGVRVELGEIEHAISDIIPSTHDADFLPMVTGCVVTATTVNEDGNKKLTAFCVLEEKCLKEIGLSSFPIDASGIICAPSPLLAALRARCAHRVRKGCIPSTFIIIERIPLSRTGKIDRNALPCVKDCITLEEANGTSKKDTQHLSSYGRCGPFVCQELITCLNLLPSQKGMLTIGTTFAMLGGDSLAATRIVRAIYASHHGLQNTRELGGEFGAFEGPFNVSHLIRAKNLGQYIDFLDSSNVLAEELKGAAHLELNVTQSQDDSRGITDEVDNRSELFQALMEAIALEQTTVAIALLREGADPNVAEHGKRLGKLKNGRIEQRETFRSNPMHLACVKGDHVLVGALLRIGKCNCKSPDSSGTFPIHLACSGLGQGIGTLKSDCDHYSEDEDRRRLGCVRLLLQEGKVPLSMKNSSKQTVLHCAVRGGYRLLLEYLLSQWEQDDKIIAVPLWGKSKADWQDRWFRSPVHWAVLHGRIQILKMLIDHGCSPTPPKPRLNSRKRTSGAVESPMEICERLYDANDHIGAKIRHILTDC